MFATKLTVFSCSAFTAKSTPTAVFVALSKTGDRRAGFSNPCRCKQARIS